MNRRVNCLRWLVKCPLTYPVFRIEQAEQSILASDRHEPTNQKVCRTRAERETMLTCLLCQS